MVITRMAERRQLPRRQGRRSGFVAAAVAAAAGLLAARPAGAQNGTWTNPATGGLWSDTNNWAGGVVADGAGSTADFSTLDITANNTVNLDSPRTLGGLIFGDTLPAPVPSPANPGGSNSWVLANNGSPANTLTLSTPTGTPTFTIKNQTATINTLLAGTQGLTKADNGVLVLTQANTGLAGPITVNTGSLANGALRITNAAALGTPTNITLTSDLFPGGGTGASLELQNGITISDVPLIMNSTGTGNRRSALRGTGGATTWGGPISVNGNNLCQFYADGTGSTLTVNGNINPGTGGFTGTLLVRGGQTGTINGAINMPAGQFAKTDGGTWIINSTGNTWLNTQVSVGTLRLGATNALPTSTVLTMGQNDANNATLDLNGRDQTISGVVLSTTGGNKLMTNLNSATQSTLTINNPVARTYGTNVSPGSLALIAGNLNLRKAGAGTLTLGSANTYSGTTTVSEGTLALGSASDRLPDTSPMTLAGGRFDTAGFSETLNTLTVSAPSSIDLGNAASVLRFASSSAQTWLGSLTVDNWSGNPDVGGGADQLYVGADASGLTPAQLSQITFTGFAPGAQILSTGEVVPIPEPGGAVVAGCMAAGLLCQRRHRAGC